MHPTHVICRRLRLAALACAVAACGDDVTGGLGALTSGPYASAITVEQDPDGLDPSINLGQVNRLRVELSGDDITVSGPDPWVDVTGTLEADGSFLASSRGTVAGVPDIAVEFQGSLDASGSLTGLYSMDVEDGIPTLQALPIIYDVQSLIIAGPFDATMTVLEDPAGHAPFIEMPAELRLDVLATTPDPGTFESELDISGPQPWVTVRGTLGADSTLFATGRGTVAGFEDIAVELDATFSISADGQAPQISLVGTYAMGVEGGLPQALPIIYGLEAVK